MGPKGGPKWVILGPFLDRFDADLRHFWAKNGSKMGQKWVKNGSFFGSKKGSFLGSIFEPFYTSGRQKRGQKRGQKWDPFFDQKRGQKWVKNGVFWALFGPLFEPVLSRSGQVRAEIYTPGPSNIQVLAKPVKKGSKKGSKMGQKWVKNGPFLTPF